MCTAALHALAARLVHQDVVRVPVPGWHARRTVSTGVGTGQHAGTRVPARARGSPAVCVPGCSAGRGAGVSCARAVGVADGATQARWFARTALARWRWRESGGRVVRARSASTAVWRGGNRGHGGALEDVSSPHAHEHCRVEGAFHLQTGKASSHTGTLTHARKPRGGAAVGELRLCLRVQGRGGGGTAAPRRHWRGARARSSLAQPGLS